MSLSSLQSSLTAVWHVGVAYAAGTIAEIVFGNLGTKRDSSKTALVLLTTGQIAGGYLLLTEVMALLTNEWTPIGDGISSTAFILAQPGLVNKLHRIRAAFVPASELHESLPQPQK